jgi:carboxypeptidase T
MIRPVTQSSVARRQSGCESAGSGCACCKPAVASRHVHGPGCDAPMDALELEALVATGAPSYFRTYEQVKAAMYALAERYPDLVEVVDAGDSAEKVQGVADRDILALRLTRKPAAGEPKADKPKVMWFGGIHAREIANPEILMRWVEQTLAGYGTDPEATALLDSRELLVLPIVNPDGHAVIERGYAQSDPKLLNQRKSTNYGHGVDLNRNFEFLWGGVGASATPTSQTYRGPSAGSEPETQAMQRFIATEQPDLFMDWHSHSRLNLFSWGHTGDPSPDNADLLGIARRFSQFNRYTPGSGYRALYPTTGTAMDYAYGQHGIPSFLIETGTEFHQTDAQFEETWSLNAPVLTFAAKIADDPYQRAKGAGVQELTIDSHGSARAVVSDAASGGEVVQRVEWFFDPATPEGEGTALVAEDGAFDEVDEVAIAQLATVGGRRLAYVRAQDASGNWGPTTAQWLDAAP